jgi:hypothetical protein
LSVLTCDWCALRVLVPSREQFPSNWTEDEVAHELICPECTAARSEALGRVRVERTAVKCHHDQTHHERSPDFTRCAACGRMRLA